MRNVTISISDDIARWARVWAAEHDTSLSAMISQTLTEKMEKESHYQTAMEGFLAKEPRPLSGGKEYPSRESLYDR
jgi:hypothetical protein